MFRVVLFVTLLATPLISQEKKLARVISEPQDNCVHELLLGVDDKEQVVSLIRRSESSQTTFSSKELQKGDVVIANTKGKDVISLSLPEYSEKDGGFVIVKYLYNGLTNNYKAFYMVLEREGQEWALHTPPPSKKRIHSIHLKPRKMAGVLVGIQNIEINQ